jgi:hypothetical protein
MITRISPANQPWTKSDLTGNSCFVQVAGEIYVVSNVQTDNTFHVYRSADNGLSFVTVQSYQFPTPNNGFDPAIYYDATMGRIHIIGSQVNPLNSVLFDIVVFTFNLNTLTLSSPFVVISGSKIRSSYDLIELPDGSYILVSSVLDSSSPSITGYTMMSIHLSAEFTQVYAIVPITSSPNLRSGNTHGGISLIGNPDGSVELYYTSHTKSVPDTPTQHSIKKRVRSVGGVWDSSSTTVYSYIGDFIDDKFTVIGINTARVFTHLYYKKFKRTLKSVLVLGYFDGAIWAFREIDSPISEPTLTVKVNDDIYLAYLDKDLVSDATGKLRVFQIDKSNLNLTERPGHYNTLSFQWLRGTKNVVDDDTEWGVVGSVPTAISGQFTPLYISELNTAPIAKLTPQAPVIQRGVPFIFDASASSDPDLDDMTYNWSVTISPPFFGPTPYTITPLGTERKTAELVVSKSIGPLPRTITVQVSVQDLSTTSAPLNPPSVVTSVATLPSNAAPVVTWPIPLIVGTRNSSVVIAPVITDIENNELTYSWRQTSGTDMPVIGGTESATLEVNLVGAKVLGEVLTFELTVSDSINVPTVASINVSVPSVQQEFLDVNRLSRVFWTSDPQAVSTPKTLVFRNQPNAWTDPHRSLSSDFFRMRTSTSSLGGDRQTMISSSSVLVTGENSTFYRKRLLPNATPGIVDAWHTDNDFTVVLTNTGMLYRYEIPGPDNCSDAPQRSINLHNYVSGDSIKRITVNGVVKDRRVIGIHTTEGLLLLQFKESAFQVESTIKLSVEDFTMYGANDVQFVRFVGVESLHKGEVLVGTLQGDEYYETLFDLSVRSVTGVWDKTVRINTVVSTGEILTAKPVGYTGLPSTPVVTVTEVDGVYIMSWSVTRPDLISSYDIEAKPNGATDWTVIQRINSGVILSTELSQISPSSKPYGLRMRSLNPDGYSPYSAETTLV